MEVYQHSVFFEARELTDREKDKIRRHFLRRRDSGGGDCGAIERVGWNSYRIVFLDKQDQERVLQRKLHRILLPGGEIQLTVRQTQTPTQPSDSFTPQTSTVSTNRELFERRIQVAPLLLKYLQDSQKAFKILQKKLSAVDCTVVLEFTEKTAVIRKNVQKTSGAAFVADTETWTGQVDKVFHGVIENYVCHPVVEPRMIKILSQDTSTVRDDVKAYFEANDVVLVGETDAVKEKVAHLTKSLPAQKKVDVSEHRFKVIEEQLSREMKVQCPGIQIVRCTESNSVEIEGNDKDVEAGAKLLQKMVQRIEERRLQVSESLWDFLVFSGAIIKYQALFLSNLSSPVFIEPGRSILLLSLSPAAMDEAEAVLKSEVSEATFNVQGAAAQPANVKRLKDILEKAEEIANCRNIRIMVNFYPAFGTLSEVRLVGYSTNVKNLQEVLQDFQRTKVHVQEEVKLSHPEMVQCFSDIFVMTGLDKTNLTLQASSYPYPRVLLSGPCHLVKDTKGALTLSLANSAFDTLVFNGPGAQQYFNGAGKDSKTLVETSCRVLIRAQETTCPVPRPRQTRSQNSSNAFVFSFGSLSSHTDTVERWSMTKPRLEIKLGSIVDEQVNAMVVPMNNRTLTSTKIGQCLLAKGGQIVKLKFESTAAGCGSAAGSVMQIDAPPSLRCSKIFFIECFRWDGASGPSVKGLAQGLRSCLDLCAQQGFSSVAFPLIGPGILLQYPVKEAVKVLSTTISQFDSHSTSKRLSTVRIVLAADYPDSPECYQTVYKHFSEKTAHGGGLRSVSGDLDDVTFALGGLKLQLIFGDTTNETTDAVVQTNHCQQNGAERLVRGDICVTRPVSFLGKPVLHVHEEHDACGIEDLMKKIIQHCEGLGCRSVAIPCICSDERRLDSATSARAMLQGVKMATSATPLTSLTNIRISLVKINVFSVFKKEATQMFSSAIIHQGAESPKHPPSDLSSLWSGSQSRRSTFLFFGLSRDSVDSAKLKLKSLHDTQFSRQTFEKSELESLTVEEAEDLRELAKSSGLHFEPGSTGHDVVVSGLKDSVGKVMQMIHVSLRRTVTAKEEADLFASVAWCILGHDGNWERLPKTANHKLENKNIQDGMEDAQGNRWMVDLSKMEARGGVLTAKLKRLENLPDFTLPLYWDNMEAEKDLAMVLLDPTSAEYRKVQDAFKQTCWESIIKIRRVQNVHLRRAYEVQKKRISEKNGDAGEKLLYHGTTQDSCRSIMKNGFDRRYAGQNGTAYGHGCYFAVHASYSSSYAKPKGDGSKLMLVARVLTGIHTPGNSTMKVPPPRDPQQPNDLYDSLVDNQHQPTLFVVFHDNQAYPDYLIHFR